MADLVRSRVGWRVRILVKERTDSEVLSTQTDWEEQLPLVLWLGVKDRCGREELKREEENAADEDGR